jgi:hypothetical protein
MSEWTIEQLDKTQERDSFSCGKESLDQFLKQYASQYQRKRIGRTFVLVRTDSKQILGYYTIAMGNIAFETLPKSTTKKAKLPNHPIPVALLGRLAMDSTLQGKGLGALLLMDVFHRVLKIVDEVGCFAIVVTAIDDDAVRF